MCSTTSHYSPPPPPPTNLHHYPQTHLHAPPHNLHHPPQTHLHSPPHTHHNYYPPPPPQTHQRYHQQEDAPPPVNPTVSSLIRRIAALESSLRRRSNRSPAASALRDAAARTIQTHFRAFLVRRSKTLRHLKHLAYIKSSLNNLKSSVSDKTHFDSQLFYRESMKLLIKLDSIQGSDPMIRDGKRSVSRELIRFMELIDETSTENRVISIKTGKKSVVLQRERNIRASSSRVLDDGEETKFLRNLKYQVKKINGFSSTPKEEEKAASLELGNPRKHGDNRNRIGGLSKSQREPKVKKSVSFDENGNVYRVFTSSNHSSASSDESDSSNGGEEVEEIGVSSKEPEVEEEDSSELSDNEIDPRNNLETKADNAPKKNQDDHEEDDEEEEEEEEEDDDDGDDSFVLSAPLPAKMEYRVDSVKKKGVKQ